MALGNYNELIATARRYAKRTSGLPDIDDQLLLAENRIKFGGGDEGDPTFTEPVRISDMVEEVSLSLGASATTLSLPDGFLEFAETPYLDGNPDYPLEAVSSSNLSRRGMALTSSGLPNEYSIIGNKMKFTCAADAAYTLPISYYALTALSSSNLTNELLTARPDIYLHALLIEIGIYIRNDSLTSTHLAAFRSAVSASDRHEKKRRFTGPLVIRSDGGTP